MPFQCNIDAANNYKFTCNLQIWIVHLSSMYNRSLLYIEEYKPQGLLVN